jgi:hypothetical protein
MGAAAIGIKLADSKFFPVLEEGRPASKILDLTTVRDNQTSVQINLFRNSADIIEDAEYVGTLIIEDISEKAAGDPTIELTLTLGDNNELSAEAVDLESGSRQVLTVSLETLDHGSLYGIPDFDLAPPDDSVQLGYDPDHQNVVIEGPVPGNAPEGLYEMNDDEKRGGIYLPAWLCILILAVGVLALVLALLVSARVLLLNKNEAQASAPVVEAPVVPAVEAPAPVEPVAATAETQTPPPVEAPAETAPAVVEQPAAPVQPEPAPEAKDTHYKIKWGDTLWDISDAYYKNPWLYPTIAKHNKIKNPNLIISGTYIDIPAKK